MTVARAWAVRITPVGPVAVGAVAWRARGQLQLTLVVKATFDLIPDGEMALAAPGELARAEVHVGDNPMRSIRVPSDLALRLPGGEITFVGHAAAPAGQPVPVLPVRLAVQRAGEALVDKKLLVYGDRAGGAPRPFDRMPLAYEHAFGGIGWNDNPLGVGLKGGKRVEPPIHNVVAPDDPYRTAGFGPIGRAWPARKRLLGGFDRRKLDADVAELPDDFDFSYFHAAPPDQRCGFFRGGDLLVLEGLHARFNRLRTRLPDARALASVHGLGLSAPVELTADTLRVDGDAMRCSVTWRAVVDVADPLLLAGLRVAAGLALPGAPIAWPVEDDALGEGGLGEVDLDDSDLASTMVREPEPPPARPSFESTVALTGDAAPAPALPFQRGVSPWTIPAAPRSPAPAAASPSGEVTAYLKVPDIAVPDLEVAPAPVPAPSAVAAPPAAFASPAAFTSPTAPEVPSRASDAIPFVNHTPLVAFTIPWETSPGHPSRAVVVKATCDLVPGAAAALRDEGDPPMGDRHAADDPNRSLAYPTDFAPFKPRADVTLTGHARAPGGRSPAAQVRFRFGHRKNGFDRRIAVFGDRTWDGAVIKLAPSAPERFETMPLVHERAFGGPGFAANPVGLGHEGLTRPPNLEDPDHLVGSPRDTPAPVGFGAVPMLWSARASKLGTYGSAWARARWPYFPEDFDPSFFQAAPPAQQLDYLDGDEPFELVGMHRDHPVLDGTLPRLRARCFAQKTTAAGGAFHEVVLRLDTVSFDVEAGAIHLVWRGLLEVADDEASDVAELFILTEGLSAPRVGLAEAQAKYRAQRLPLPPVADDPDAPAPANDPAEPPAQSAHERRIEERLRAAGVLGAAASAASAPPPALPPPSAERGQADPALRAQVVALLARNASLEGLDFSGADLSDLDFSSRSLVGVILTDTLLRRARFVAADLAGAQLGNADLTDAVLERASLQMADLTGAILDGARLDGAQLDAAVLEGVFGERASLLDVRGARARLGGSVWTRARFDRASLPGADFTASQLDEAVFDGASLPEIRLYEARGLKVSFKGASLPEARADGVCLLQSSLRGVAAPGSIWDGALLDDTSFLGATLPGASFVKASGARAIFSGADLTEARMSRARLAGASFLKANLMAASLEGADLTGADLRASNLHAADTWKAKLRGAQLELALVTQSKLEGSKPA
jgi:uncharacterized protein YjbI with pentapeptide repeats